jgi:aspartyl-tRNA(Asn)/glutamyl-tRNA(Gln) amidotransferase subunit A
MVASAVDLHWLTITEAARLFRTRALSPVELTRHLLDRAERYQPALAAFVTLTPEIALEQARAAEAAFLRGEPGSPLRGIPLGYKDIYCTTGVRTTCGSRLMAEHVPAFDATTVAKLNDAGAVMLGKTTTWEFASGSGDLLHSFFPSARNPWDTSRSPAGSSSGSGAALAAGLVVGALGTDTGGSIRSPAAVCGVTGHKPTYGLCSRFGVFPLAWTLDHTGPMARTVEDCAVMLTALAGYDPRDPASARVPVTDYAVGLGRGVRGLRLGVPGEAHVAGVDPEMLAAMRAAVEVLHGLGMVVREVELPAPLGGNFAVEGHAAYRDDLLASPEGFGPRLLARMLAGGAYFASEYLQQQRLRALLQAALREVLLECDVIIGVTRPRPALLMEEEAAGAGGSGGGPTARSLFNLSGLPSLTVPAGFNRDGLPLSIMLSGRPFDDATVLRAGHAFQQATDWHTRHPDV